MVAERMFCVVCLPPTHGRLCTLDRDGSASQRNKQKTKNTPPPKNTPRCETLSEKDWPISLKYKKKVTKIDFLLRLLFIQMIAILFLEQHVGVTTQRFLERQIEVLALGFC